MAEFRRLSPQRIAELTGQPVTAVIKNSSQVLGDFKPISASVTAQPEAQNLRDRISALASPVATLELQPDLGRTVDDYKMAIGEKIWPKTRMAIQKLDELDQVTREAHGISAIDFILLTYHSGTSLKQLERITSLSIHFLAALFDKLGFPRLSRAEAHQRWSRTVPIEVRRARMAYAKSTVTPERRSEMSRNIWVDIPQEVRKARSRAGGLAASASSSLSDKQAKAQKMHAAMMRLAPEQRSAIAKQGWDRLTPDQRRERIAKNTPEQRAISLRAAWEASRNLPEDKRKARGRKARATYVARTTEQERAAAMQKLAQYQTTEHRSRTMKDMWARVPDEHRGDWGKAIYPSTLGRLTPEERARNSLKASEAMNSRKVVWGDNYYDSHVEAATAVAFETFIPNFRIERGVNYQVITDNSFKKIDFMVNGVFVEYNPVVLRCYPGSTGAFDSQEEYLIYTRHVAELSELDKDEYNDQVQKALRERYFRQRRDAIDQDPRYLGRELIIAATPEELYEQVIKRFGEGYHPTAEEFVRFFEYTTRKIKNINKKPKK